jgi:DnaJ family protein B protein 12
LVTGGFDTGPGFVFNLGGGPGVRVHQFGGGRPRRRPRVDGEEQPPQSASSILTSLLPLILLFIFPLLSSIFSSSTPAGPTMRFEAAEPPHTVKHTSSRLKVNYWVNPAEVKDYTKSQRKQLDDKAERRYMQHLNVNCDFEQQTRAQLMQDAQGWFFQDDEKMTRARNMEMSSCRKLNELTRRANSWL